MTPRPPKFDGRCRKRSVAAALDDRRGRRSPLVVAGCAGFAPRTAHRAPQKLRLLVMRNRRALALAPRRLSGLDTDIRLRRTIGTIRPVDPLRTILALRSVAPLVALAALPVPTVASILPVGIAPLATISAAVTTLSIAIVE